MKPRKYRLRIRLHRKIYDLLEMEALWQDSKIGTLANRILQEELHCTAVRTSHYPQSPYFLDECDRRGLLVFTELPGWQHIGDDNWKDAACEMLREMLLQNRNHPSIILWGVRINESVDDDAFYTRTNQIAHQLDPSRATSGVRYLEKSHLLEDVYAYNDFSHNGVTPGAKPKKDVTPDMGKALLISECNGHMYPTKSCDDAPHRQEHALRHARVLDAAYADGEHAGCFGWCMFDYATHKDFGSGDRICYHGVLDSFRNPKLAASVYASQGGEEPVLTVNLLRLTNSVGSGMATRITSLRHAITILGRRQLLRWLQLLLYSGSSSNAPTVNPLLQLAATRGRLMELLVDKAPEIKEGGRELIDQAFMVGILSLMPTLTSVSMDEVLAQLPVAKPVQDGLLSRGGILGNLLTLIESLENEDHAKADEILARLPDIDAHYANNCLTRALTWANNLAREPAT